MKWLFEAQKAILIDLFGEDWFVGQVASRKGHPAYQRWSLCSKLISQNGIIKWPEDRNDIREIASLILDNYFLIQCSGGEASSKVMTLGAFSAYGDERVRRRVSSVIYEPEGFSSLLTELSFAAWNMFRGFTVTPYEDEGYPDFQIEFGDWAFPVVADCKRIQRNSNRKRYKKIVDKANSQIKALGEECYGLVVVDVTEKVSNPTPFTVPGEVRSAEEALRKAVKKYNTSVSAVLLFWDEFISSGDPTGSSSSLFAMQRRSMVIDHENPKHELPNDFVIREYSYTVDFPVFWKPRSSEH